MSTTPGYRARAVELRRQASMPLTNYDHYRLYRGTRKTVGDMKAERLRVKNERRAKAGLPPKASYSEI